VIRVRSLVILALAAVVALGAISTALAQSSPTSGDSGSISRDASGRQTVSDHDPLGGPPTPRVHGFGQAAIMAIGIALLAVAAVLAAYTVALARRPPDRR
jgi:hypothetical protein